MTDTDTDFLADDLSGDGPPPTTSADDPPPALPDAEADAELIDESEATEPATDIEGQLPDPDPEVEPAPRRSPIQPPPSPELRDAAKFAYRHQPEISDEFEALRTAVGVANTKRAAKPEEKKPEGEGEKKPQ